MLKRLMQFLNKVSEEKSSVSAPEKVSEYFSDTPPLRECEWTGIPSLGTLHALVVADGHGRLMQQEIEDELNGETPDVVFFLGDNDFDDIEAVKDVLSSSRIPMMGVHGNHDFDGTLEEHGIQNLHGKVIEWNGILIGGFGGSIRYKDDDRYVMFTNEESESVMQQMPRCNILLTHDVPCFFVPTYIHAHAGLIGIGHYIEKHHPEVCLHGHLHDKSIQMHTSGTIIRCCYRAEHIRF